MTALVGARAPSNDRTTIAVLHESRFGDVALRLEEVAQSLSFDSEAALLEAAGHRAFKRIVAPPSHCSISFLSAVESTLGPGAIAFWYDRADESRLTAAAGKKHVFHVLPEPADPAFQEAIKQWLLPRVSQRVAADGIACSLTLSGGATLSGELVDVSAFGLSVTVPLAKVGGELYPGATVGDIRLRRDGAVILEGVGGTVRYCAVKRTQDDSVVGYQLGIELTATRGRDGAAKPKRSISDRVQLLGYLRNAVGYAEITVKPVHETALAATCYDGEVDADSETIRLIGELPSALRDLDTVDVSFDLWGKNYKFASTLLDRDAGAELPSFRVRVPRLLVEHTSREVARFKPRADVKISAQVQSPILTAAPVEVEIRDVTASGCAFVYDSRQGLFPLGTVIPNLVLRFPTTTLEVGSADVRSVEQRGPYAIKVGVEFQPLSALQRARIYDAIVHCDKPGIRKGGEFTFETLWDFFLATGFLYPEKLARLDQEAVRTTFQRLMAQPTPLAQFIRFEEGGETFGQVSALRAYNRTCLAQHLAAKLKRVPLGRMLSMAMVQFQEYQPEVEWMKLFYRPNNRWPRQVFGSFATRASNSVDVDHTTYDYLTAPLGAPLAPRHKAIRPLGRDEEAELESYFIEQGRTAQMRAEDFVSGRCALTEIDGAYKELGLTRRREILTYEDRGRLRGFAALEISSIGLNLSELTNSFRVLVHDHDPAVIKALAAAAAARYQELGFMRCVALGEGFASSVLQEAGFTKEKEYACVIWHRSTYGHYSEHVHRVTPQDYR